MARISDTIEEFIKILLRESEENKLQIQRNELATKFNCAPSQINYVLTTRFTHERGYLIESRRGGGGYIVIKKVTHKTENDRNKLIMDRIGNSITYHNTLSLLNSLYEHSLIDKPTINLIKIALNDRTLQSAEDKNKIRADILKAMILVGQNNRGE